MADDTVDGTAFAKFLFQFERYKELLGIGENSQHHLLECLSEEIYEVLFSTYGREVQQQSERHLLTNIQRLVVRQRNMMASVMFTLQMTQASDQKFLNFIAKLKASAQLCNMVDTELQEELLTKTDLTLVDAG